ncbi:transglycosylase domain-containing protein [Enemella evansiae]|uniref:transglycosylase domain-containing protein n=1 Tax=Enemella evansiae TaxID=2016499 RepID=UPI000B960F66|nr:transglycosylase domain-containing protein [Enemella evansiae]OYO02016.1 penicillin-binding protein [Enemella evansiae]
MAKTSARAGSLVYRAIMFFVVSVFAGLLVAGLFIPFAGMAGAATKAVATGMDNLPAELETPPQSQQSKVLMNNGEVLATFWEENRIYKPLDQISPLMQKAQIAIEDHRFYEHGALDTRATLRALVRNTTSSAGTQGGSSLTQQYVKQVQIEAAKQRGDEAAQQAAQAPTVSRKIQELRYAVALEKRLSKDQILERYLNIAYYGDGAYGVEQAAKHYFNTTAKDLTLDQAAMLAGLVQNPAATDPVNNPTIATERRNVVLNRMAELNIANQADVDEAKKVQFDASKIQRFPNGCVGTRYPFLCDYVKRSLEKMPALGNTPSERLDTLKRGGLTIQTEIDPTTQDAAEKAIAKNIDARDPVISTMTMIQPGTGLILAMAQSRPVMGDNAGAGESYYNYAVGGSTSDNDMGGAEGYQAGSTFKAFTAAAALEQGMPLSKTYNAAASMDFAGKKYKSCRGTEKVFGDWTVKNSTGTNGVMDMYKAAAYSVNTYFVQLIMDVGGCETTKMAEKLGVKLGSKGNIVDQFNAIPSFTLGSAEITPLSLTEAYATFASGGKHCEPIILKKITDKNGKDIPVQGANCKQVITPQVAAGMNSLLAGVMSGTGRPATIPGGYPQAGKTGTIDDNQAVWFAGYTPEVTGVAMIAVDKTHPYWKSRQWSSGNRKPTLKGITLPTRKKYTMQGSGGGDAGADVYVPSMSAALRGKPKTKFGNVGKDVTEGKPVAIPSVKGMSPDAAKAALEDAGFTVGRTTRTDNSSSGTYLGLSQYGTAPMGSTINLVYSSGPAAKPAPKQTQAPATTRPPAQQQPAAPPPAAPAPAAPPPAPAPAPAPPPPPAPAPTTQPQQTFGQGNGQGNGNGQNKP